VNSDDLNFLEPIINAP